MAERDGLGQGAEVSAGQAGLPGKVAGGGQLAGHWMAGWGRSRRGCGAAQVRPGG